MTKQPGDPLGQLELLRVTSYPLGFKDQQEYDDFLQEMQKLNKEMEKQLAFITKLDKIIGVVLWCMIAFDVYFHAWWGAGFLLTSIIFRHWFPWHMEKKRKQQTWTSHLPMTPKTTYAGGYHPVERGSLAGGHGPLGDLH